MGTWIKQRNGLARPGNTRWGSHFRISVHITSMYPKILEVLIKLEKILDKGLSVAKYGQWCLHLTQSFEFLLHAHLMFVILGYTVDLS
jgi:hypothetical protein